MKLTFLGATHEVTGSCYYLEACGKRIIIDYGMEQGRDWFVNQPIPVGAGMVDMVLLTHAHIDHSGRLPLLVQQGFKGQIFATEGTTLLCDIMLRDSAHIQEFEAEWKNRKNERAGRPSVEPMYTTEDAQATMKCFVSIPYEQERYIADGISVRFTDAGHLLGSASIEVKITEEGQTRTLIFSGDIGNLDQPLIKDPVYPETADYVIMESTYGDRAHEIPEEVVAASDAERERHLANPEESVLDTPMTRYYIGALAKVLQTTLDRGGNVVIPSFAVGRTQEMLYFIRQIKEEGLVKGHDGFPVWVDSPLAVEATSIFQKRMFYDFDDEARAVLDRGVNPIGFEGLKLAISAEDSKLINSDETPKVIISASGMCEAGRIRHHLKHNLWRSESVILFVGYQAEGTLGRLLVEGADKVKIFGEEITVNAQILVLPGISGHADNAGLMRWIGAMKEKPKKVFVIHGEDKVTEIFAGRLREELGMDAYAPYSGTIFDLVKGEFIYEAEPIPIETEEPAVAGGDPSAAVFGKAGSIWKDGSGAEAGAGSVKQKDQNRSTPAYEALVASGNALMQTIRQNKGGANADLRKFASQIDKLIKKWQREP